ncbi:hypothetical protein PsorP6_010409 [Peronosclerospora sorghi]|uniref:Uncharacterized protein n=1 Tax=Peronosclerospora sorghi TaxID=230839 RepID=A0ACC0VXC7_9STRA|nr:hypothetical protein PsorP6_010409 [Peronosclerospora sorghi]
MKTANKVCLVRSSSVNDVANPCSIMLALCRISVGNGQYIITVEVRSLDIELIRGKNTHVLVDVDMDNIRDTLIEVKKEVKASHDFRVLSGFVAFDLLVDELVTAPLTHLNTLWQFWVSGEGNNSARIHKGTIKNSSEAFW